MKVPPFLFLALLLLSLTGMAQEEEKKVSPPAFEFLTNPSVKMSIRKAEIKRGIREPGDPRDKLPPIYKPKIITAKQAGRFLVRSSRVLGIRIGTEARAYPLLFLALHEMVNDTLGGRPIAPNY